MLKSKMIPPPHPKASIMTAKTTKRPATKQPTINPTPSRNQPNIARGEAPPRNQRTPTTYPSTSIYRTS
ncbi:hypothetical protein BC567DRAFT_234479 [Phyllosticta citribraziliensis]